MNDTQKMLQTIINGQSAFRQDVLGRIDKLDKKLTDRIDSLEGSMDSLDQKIDRVEENLTKRLDKIGKSLAYLEDDTPDREEFDKLEKRVVKLEEKSASV